MFSETAKNTPLYREGEGVECEAKANSYLQMKTSFTGYYSLRSIAIRQLVKLC